MATRIRLQRHGKKGKPFYHVVAADTRAKRDGRYIEKIGTYNPNTNPATIEVKHERAIYWLGVGAQPSDTARSILKHTGAIYHNHLLKGVAKGAMNEAEATKRFEAWYSDKQGKNDAQLDAASAATNKINNDILAAEKKFSDARAAKIASAASVMAAEASAAAEEAAAAQEASVAEEATATEEAPAVEEAPVAEESTATEEAPAVEEAPAAEAALAVEEAPAAEAAPAVEEAPAAEAAPAVADEKKEGEAEA